MSYDTYRTGTYEQEVNDDVATLVDSPEHTEITLIDVTVEYADPVPPRQPERVDVTVGYPIGTEPPPIADQIQSRASVRAESALRLPTGPVVESQPAEVVVHYTARGQ